MPIRVLTLPGLRILSATGEVGPLAGRRVPRALLVYLAVERSASRDTLLGLLWPERDEERARHSLSQTLYELRRALGEDCVAVTGDTLTIGAHVETDLARFEAAVAGGRWEEALEQYGGGFLEGVYLAATHGFEEWLERRHAQVARMHRRARREVLAQRLQAGDLVGALAAAERWAELDPLEDEAQQRAIELLARAGRRSEALKHYELFRERLRREELEPMAELTALVGAISAGAFEATPQAAAASASAASLPAAAPTEVAPARSAAVVDTGGSARAVEPSMVSATRTSAPKRPGGRLAAGRRRDLATGVALGLPIGVPVALLAVGLVQVLAPEIPVAVTTGVITAACVIGLVELAVAALAWWRRRRLRIRPRLESGPGRLGGGLGFALGVLVALTGAYVAAGRDRGPIEVPQAWNEVPQPRLGGARKVLVTRFRNRSGDAGIEPIGRMAEDWLMRRLGSIPEAVLAAAMPVAAGDSSLEAARRLGRRTGANLVVFGSYYADGPDVLLSALIAPAASAGGEAGDTALQEIGPVRVSRNDPAAGAARLASLVAGAVASGCTFPACVRGRVPPTYDAWRAWIDAHTALREGEDSEAAEEGYRRAIALDSGFVSAIIDLGRFYLQDGRCARVDSLGDMLEARTDGVSEYDLLSMRAMRATCHNDRSSAYDNYVLAWEAAPQLAEARFRVAQAAAATGRLDEAERILRQLSASSVAAAPGYYFVYLRVLHAEGRYAEELRLAERGRQRTACACSLLFPLRALAALGRTADLEHLIGQAEAGDLPRVPVAELYRVAGAELEWHGHPQAAKVFARKALEALDPFEETEGRTTVYRVRRAVTLLQLDRWAEARRMLDGVVVAADAPRILPLDLAITRATVLAYRGIAAARAGDPAAARAALGAIERLPDADVLVPGLATREVCEAAVLSALGDTAEARARLAIGRAAGTLPPLGREPLLHAEILLRDLWHDPQIDGTPVAVR